jgi:zinc-ribbon domain
MDLRRRRTPRIILPSPGALRRERRALLQAREEGLRDLGGLILEMFRRNRFNDELVRERCAELVDLDRHLDELDEVLRAATHRAPLRRCECGTEIPPFARFCPGCGRDLTPPGDGEEPVA